MRGLHFCSLRPPTRSSLQGNTFPCRFERRRSHIGTRRTLHLRPSDYEDGGISAAELSRLMEEHAEQPPRPLTLSTLLSLADPVTPESVLTSVRYVTNEIPRRMAMRARSLEALPYIVGMNPFIARSLEAYRKSFRFLTMYPPVQTLEDNQRLTAELDGLVQSHANDIPTMAKG